VTKQASERCGQRETQKTSDSMKGQVPAKRPQAKGFSKNQQKASQPTRTIREKKKKINPYGGPGTKILKRGVKPGKGGEKHLERGGGGWGKC